MKMKPSHIVPLAKQVSRGRARHPLLQPGLHLGLDQPTAR